TPGTRLSSIEPGEKPSARFHSAGRSGTPSLFFSVVRRCTRRPVGVPPSATVYQSFGNGSRQAAGSIGSQPGPAPAAAAGAAGGTVRSAADTANAARAERARWGRRIVHLRGDPRR